MTRKKEIPEKADYYERGISNAVALSTESRQRRRKFVIQ